MLNKDYTYHLSCLKHEFHACEYKTLISRQITSADQFLMPDSQMWTSKL